MREQSLFVEKYRPKTIEECILPSRLKDFFQAQIDKGEIQNMLLIGGAGTGKTTAAKALCILLLEAAAVIVPEITEG